MVEEESETAVERGIQKESHQEIGVVGRQEGQELEEGKGRETGR